jgi:hypothetical protein
MYGLAGKPDRFYIELSCCCQISGCEESNSSAIRNIAQIERFVSDIFANEEKKQRAIVMSGRV